MTQKSSLTIGRDRLTIEDVESVVRHQQDVELDDGALNRVAKSYETLIAIVEEGFPVYGVTHGVGQNVDRRLVPDQNNLKWSGIQGDSQAANKSLLFTHSASIGDRLIEEEVRAAILIRLNGLMHGRTGCRPQLCEDLKNLLVSEDLPAIHEGGSVGQADIVQGGAIGLAIFSHGIDILEGRDALALAATNAITLGRICLCLQDIRALMQAAEVVFLCSLNAIDGNTEPFDPQVVQYQSPRLREDRIVFYENALAGSYLTTPNTTRNLQDPLSFRCSPSIFELCELAFSRSKHAVEDFLESVEDNPLVLNKEESINYSQSKVGVLEYGTDELGRVVPNANFCPSLVMMELQTLSSMLAQVGVLSAQRTIRLCEPKHTGLRRFLSSEEAFFGFCALQKVPVALSAELRSVSSPSLIDQSAMAGGIEDYSTHLPLLFKSLKHQARIIHQLLAVELLHASQAMSLRRCEDEEVSFGSLADKVLLSVRDVVPLYRDDRELSADIQKMEELVTELSEFYSGNRTDE